MRNILIALILISSIICTKVYANDERVIKLDEYVILATVNDTVFQEILIETRALCARIADQIHPKKSWWMILSSQKYKKF